MAARKQTGANADPNFDDIEESVEVMGGEDLIDQLSKLATELGQETEVTCKIFITPEGPMRKWEYVGECDADQFSLEWLRREHGPGEYKVRVYAEGKIYTTRDVRIAKTRKDDAPQADGVNKIIELMQKSGTENAALIVSLLKQQQQPMKSFLTPEIIAALITAVPATIAAFGELLRSRPAGESLKPQDVVELLMAGRELAGDSEKGSSTNANDVFKTLIEKFGPALAEGVKASQGAPQLTQEQPHVNPMVMYIKSKLDPLMQAAARNDDPAQYVETVIEATPPAVLDHLLNAPDPVTELAKFHPEAEKHRGWLGRFIPLLNAEFTGPDGDNQAQVDA